MSYRRLSDLLSVVVGVAVGAVGVLILVAGISYVYPPITRLVTPAAPAAPIVKAAPLPAWDFQREVTTLEAWCRGTGVAFHGHRVTILCNDKVVVDDVKADLAALNRTRR